jgi:hypothetical protein
MSGFISSSPFQNTKRFLQIQYLAPGIARRSSGRFQLRRQLRRAITLNPCIVCQIRGYRCVRLVEGFVGARSVHRLDPPNLRQSTDFSSAPARVFFPGEKPSLLCLGFLRFPVRAGPPHSLLTFPGGGAPPHPFPLPWHPYPPSPATAAVAGGANRAPAPHARAPIPAAVVVPYVAALAAGQPDPTRPPMRNPLLFPSSLFYGWEEKDERKKTMIIL